MTACARWSAPWGGRHAEATHVSIRLKAILSFFLVTAAIAFGATGFSYWLLQDSLTEEISHFGLHAGSLILGTVGEAERMNSTVISRNPDDQPARMYAARAEHALRGGVAKDWTGVEILDSK